MTHISLQCSRGSDSLQAVAFRPGRWIWWAGGLVALLLAGCYTPIPPRFPPGASPIAAMAPTVIRKAAFTPATFSDLPGWAEDDLSGLAQALRRQCAGSLSAVGPRQNEANTAAQLPQTNPTPSGLQSGLQVTCRLAATLPQEPAVLRTWLEAQFTPWAIEAVDAGGGTGTTGINTSTSTTATAQTGFEGLITGYYEPLLHGSRSRNPPFLTPIRARPDDLLVLDLGSVYPETRNLRLRGRIVTPANGVPRVVPYGDRTELGTQVPVNALAWVDDPVDAFFLEIQGSGRVRFEDGSILRIGYADQNGHPYRPIGRELIRRGVLPASATTAPAIREWLRANPQDAPSVMASNPSVVFFRELPAPREADEGPPGALGVALTPTRSVAVDPKALPLGTMLYVSTTHPGRDGRLERMVVAQDTGGAIRGPVRADFFWGFDAVGGQTAADLAGRMRSSGRLWLLWPRGESPPAY